MKKPFNLAITTAVFFLSLNAYAQTSPKKDSIKTQSIETVTMTKKVIQKKSDRLIYDVAASPISKGNTAFNILKETPLVSSTDDKTLKIAGKNNAVIFINGRRTQMNADALQAFLKNTPAENIQKIEVITMPGSEFNVESRDGVINIILKKKMSDGTNGNLRFSNTQAKYNNQSSSASINTRKGKWGANANFSYNENTNQQEYILKNGGVAFINNTNVNIDNTSVGAVKMENKDFGGYINVDYALTDNQNLGLSYNAWFSKKPGLQSDLFNTVSINSMESYNRSQNFGNGRNQNNSLNLNYEIKLDDKGSKLNANVAYLNFNKKEMNYNTTDATNLNGDFVENISKFNQSSPQKIDNYSSTLDYVKVFKKFTMGLGGNFNRTKTDNDTYFEKLENGTFVKDENQSNHFVYTEKISGIYANIEKNFSEKFTTKLGARWEYTDSFGEILGTPEVVKRKNSNILPSLNLNYSISNNHSLSYAFTSRVRRPSFWELNPVRIFLTETNYVQNNPFLKQSSVFNQELMYMYKSAYFVQVTNNYTKDAATQVPLQREITKDGNTVRELRYIRTNYGTENNFAFNIGMNKNFFKQIWTTNYVIGMQFNKFTGVVDTDPITGDQFSPFNFGQSLVTPFVQLNNTVRLSAKKDFFVSLNYFYLGKSRIDLGTLKPIQQFDINIKKMLNDWTFSLDINDIFKTNIVDIYDKQATGNYNYINQYYYSRRATLSVTYNFGNQKIQKVRSMEGAADAIKNRTGK